MPVPVAQPVQRSSEPADGAERKLLLGWLAFHREAIEGACAGLSDDELTRRSVLPSPLSLHGVVRQLTELEHRYLVHGIGGAGSGDGGSAEAPGYGAPGGPDADLELLHSGDAQASLARWRAERARADALLMTGKLTDKGLGNGRSLRWNLLKVIGEYARQHGHADLLRQRIDGTTSGSAVDGRRIS